jgi:hypothetical protein
MGKVGRPTAYKPEYTVKAFGYALLGLTDVQMAEKFGVSESTFNLWKKKHPEFSESLKAGKEDADSKVVNALYEKACNGDTTAMIFWLKNRQRFSWRDKVNHEHTGENGGPIETNFTVEFVKTKEKK